MLDEITAALPVDLSERVFAVARRWRERGNSIIFISHRMAEVAALCDRATVLRDGVTVGVTDIAEGSEDQIVSLMLGVEPVKAHPSEAKRGQSDRDAAEDPALSVHDLSYGHSLKNVSFAVRPGEILGVAALEGQGQQELFDCIAGVSRHDGGEIVARGRKLKLNHPGDAIAAGLVLVPANRLQALLPQRSIRENVALPLVRNPRDWGLIRGSSERERVGAAVKRLQIDARAGSELRRLSGGNQQKVVIARWVAAGFQTLLCFDPTRGIDVGTKHQIYRLLRELADAGSSVLLFTSELPEISLVCDRAIVLFGGEIVAEMPASEADEGALLRAAHGLSGARPVRGAAAAAAQISARHAKPAGATPMRASSLSNDVATSERGPWTYRQDQQRFRQSSGADRHAGAAGRLPRGDRGDSSDVRFVRLAICRDGGVAIGLRRRGAGRRRHLGRHRPVDRVGHGGRKCARGEHDEKRQLCRSACSSRLRS